MLKQADLDGLAFPVVRVRYAGPTDHRGSRYVASCRGTTVTHSYDSALSASVNARHAAERCLERYHERLAESVDIDFRPSLLIPGDLSRDSYCFTVVPTAYLGDD